MNVVSYWETHSRLEIEWRRMGLGRERGGEGERWGGREVGRERGGEGEKEERDGREERKRGKVGGKEGDWERREGEIGQTSPRPRPSSTVAATWCCPSPSRLDWWYCHSVGPPNPLEKWQQGTGRKWKSFIHEMNNNHSQRISSKQQQQQQI